MAYTIAISGKGGTGKTTFAAMVIKHITQRLDKAVLAVDADPNANLNTALGVKAGRTIADIRDEVIENKMKLAQTGVSKERLIEYEIQASVQECGKFDLITMGRPEGPGCYCYVNNLLRNHLSVLTADFPYVVIDNEAGMEHLSRRTTNDVDVLFVVSEPTVVGIRSAKNVYDLTGSLPIKIKEHSLVLNRVPTAGVHPEIEKQLKEDGLAVAGRIAHDGEVEEFSITGRPILELPDTNAAYVAATEIFSKYLN
ncbi:MAG: AAA family ATPase [Planctomycetota bacterium]